MTVSEIQQKIQAVLFASGDPFEGARLAFLLEIDESLLDKLIQDCNQLWEKLPFEILKLDTCYQMVSKPDFAPFIREALESKRNTPLSQAALEVLAIIAYNQPVTKSFVEQVRGIESGSVVNSLVVKALVEEAGRLELPGRPISYRTTAHFLRCFGMKGIEALPKIPAQA